MDKVTIIVGPRASGKTRNAEAFKAHYGATRVVDDWDGMARLEPGDLALYTGAASRDLRGNAEIVAKGGIPGGVAVEMVNIERALEAVGAGA